MRESIKCRLENREGFVKKIMMPFPPPQVIYVPKIPKFKLGFIKELPDISDMSQQENLLFTLHKIVWGPKKLVAYYIER